MRREEGFEPTREDQAEVGAREVREQEFGRDLGGRGDEREG